MRRDEEKIYKVFGTNVRTIRKQKGISLERIAHDVGFTIELVFRIERGEYRIKMEHVRRLSVYLGEHPANMLREGGIKKQPVWLTS